MNTIIIYYKQGKKDLNDMIKRMDLGMEGVYVHQEATITTKSEITDKLIEEYKEAIIKAGDECGMDIEIDNVEY